MLLPSIGENYSHTTVEASQKWSILLNKPDTMVKKPNQPSKA